jgi:hypothetical protein
MSVVAADLSSLRALSASNLITQECESLHSVLAGRSTVRSFMGTE